MAYDPKDWNDSGPDIFSLAVMMNEEKISEDDLYWMRQHPDAECLYCRLTSPFELAECAHCGAEMHT